MVWGPWGMREPWGGAPGVCESPHKQGRCLPVPGTARAQETTAVIVSRLSFIKENRNQTRGAALQGRSCCCAHTGLGLAGGGGSEWRPRSPAPGPPPKVRPSGTATCRPLPLTFVLLVLGCPCVLGTSPGCAPLTGCRALPLSRGQGTGSFQPLLGPSPHFPRGFVGPELPRKVGGVTSTIVTGSRHPTFTDEERKLRRARPWPWWAGHPGNSVGPHPGLDAQGRWEDRDPKHRSTQATREPSGRRGAPEALGQRWRGGGGARAQTGRG